MPYNSHSDQNTPMDSLPPHLSNHDPLSSTSTARRRGSTSQMCLHRILTTITTVPPPLPAAEPSLLVPSTEETNGENDARCVSKCSRFDLNSPEAKEPLSSTSSGGGGGSDVDHEDGGDRDVRSLSLLIEAAKLIFGDFVDEDKSELKERNGFELKRNDAAVEIGAEFGETPPAPVVRSKRGRTRVLPCRYRDSVLEPLPRFSRTGSTVIPPKRRRG